jgi:hypothetical protein
MKLGVIMTGFLRTNRRMYSFLEENLLRKYNSDLYCVSWQTQEDGSRIEIDAFDLYSKYLKKSKIESNEDYYKNKKVFMPIHREGDVFAVDERAKTHGSYWANRLMDQWWLVRQGFSMIEDPTKYDLILRLRYDIRIHNIKLLNSNSLVIPADVGGWDFTDHMAYGPPEIMKIYSNLHNEIYNLYVEDNIDITHATNMPKHYINKNKLNYLIDNRITYEIIK